MTGIAQMPKEIKKWLNGRGINDGVIELFHVTWDDKKEEIVIPVVDAQGNFLFNKYRKNPFDTTDKPKYRYEYGSSVALYGVQFLKGATQVFICEGELDALVLHSRGWNAVSSTGGSGTFRESWANLFNDKVTYIIYDNDTAGYKGAFKTLLRVPNAKIIWLPKEVGEHGDITDYFQGCGSLADFDKLIDGASSYNLLIVPEEEITTKKKRREVINDIKERIAKGMEEASSLRSDYKSDAHIQVFIQYLTIKYQEQQRTLKFGSHNKNPKYRGKGFTSRIEQAKKVPINQYVEFNHQGFARCLWHQEKTGSLFWYRNTNHVKCFGGCGMRYDILDVVQKLNGVDLKGALEILVPEKLSDKLKEVK